MTQGEHRLNRETRQLIEVIDQLRSALLTYKRACEGMLRAAAGPGQPASDTIETMERLKVRERRQAVTEAMDEFEAARYRVRVGLIEAAQNEGRNLSDVARALGVSRQLVSRLGKEGDDAGRTDAT